MTTVIVITYNIILKIAIMMNTAHNFPICMLIGNYIKIEYL